MKLLWVVWILVVISGGVAFGVYVTTPVKPKVSYVTLTQYQILESQVKNLEKGQKRLETVVGLRGKEARKEGLQQE